jgi:tetratricopeptide (TPR) repeat protein
MNRFHSMLVVLSLSLWLGACAGARRDAAATPPAAANAIADGDAHAGMNMGGGDSDVQEPIDYIPSAIGTHEWKVTTRDAMAQNYFNQGMQLRWAYNMTEAARSMAEARRLDPSCAMCFWGEAFALGSYLNGSMTAKNAPLAHAAIEKAVELTDGASAMERDLILAARVRYPADYDPENRRPVDEAFAREMAKVYEKYPENHEVAVVYAVSLFLLEERRGYRDINDPDLQRLHGVLTGVLKEDITHPGACHLYVHATESSQRPDWALECADHLSDAIPIASHIQHMPSHTWNEVGLWGKSVVANTRAWHSDLKAGRNLGFSYAPSHNLHMLLFAASMDGQGAVATQAGKDYAKLDGDTIYQVLTLLRFGRFDEILEVTKRPEGEVQGGYWDFAQGYAELRQGNVAKAKAYLRKVRDLAESSDATFRMHSAKQTMGLSAEILEGEILREEGDLEGAIASFRKAAAWDDEQPYDEPEPIPYAARHWLGAALLEAGRYAEAEQEYRTELRDHPHNVWSLYGLMAALEAQGKSDPEVAADFETSTARCDTWITASRF